MIVVSVGAGRPAGADRVAADSYYVYRPSTLDRSHPVPLVVTFGGKIAESQTGLDDAANRNGFVVAYITPGKSYNDEIEKRGPGPPLPDTIFIAGTIDTVIKDQNIDPNRVYATGASGGGTMSYRLACDFPQKVAAIGPVSADNPVRSWCRPKIPVGVIAIHGTADPYIPFSAAQASIDPYLAADGCPAKPKTSTAGRLTTYTWSPCRLGTDVTMIKFQGGDHAWYRGQPIDAANTIWAFFAAHRRAAQELLSAAVSLRRTVRAGESLKVLITSNQDVSVRLTLRSRRKTLAVKRAALKAGSRQVLVAVPRSAGAGTAKLTVRLQNANTVKLLTRTVRISSPRH